MPKELFKRFENTCGVAVVEGYGLTEATCLVSCNPPTGAKKVGSVGLPLPYTDVRIFNDTADGPVECDGPVLAGFLHIVYERNRKSWELFPRKAVEDVVDGPQHARLSRA